MRYAGPGRGMQPLQREQTGVVDQIHTTTRVGGRTISQPYYPVMPWNGLIRPNVTARLSQGGADYGRAPILIRQWTNLGYNDVQLHNGMGRGQLNGQLYPYYQQVFVWAYMPRIPGQTRGDVGGFHKRGPSIYNVQDMLMNGPGSQPEHPGGPGQVAGTTIINPMSG
jgi:hypothetical protein